MKRKRSMFSVFALSAMALVLVLASVPRPSLLDARSPHESQLSRPGTRHTAVALGNRVSAPSRLAATYGRLPLSFEINQGQIDAQVKFLSRGQGYGLFLTSDEAVLSLAANRRQMLPSGKELGEFPGIRARIPRSLFNQHRRGSSNLKTASGSSVRLKLLGADPHAQVVGLEELPGKVNYFIGNDPKKWRTNVPTFAKVKYENVYPGVDLVYYGNQEGRLEYDFVVAPGADPNVIRLAVATDGESPLEINPAGDLIAKVAAGEIHLQKPVVYQEKSPASTVAQRQESNLTDAINRKSAIGNRKFLESNYVLTADNRVGFEVAGYDKTQPLVIDPVLVYSTYLGGSGFDGGFAIAVDSSGSMYVTGFTESADFPTVNPFGTFRSLSENAMVVKLNPDGTALEYSSYFGGSANLTYGSQAGAGIAVDSSGNAYIAGYTDACDFPTVNALQPSWCNFPMTGFVVKLNAAGNALLYSTYLGGNNYNWGDWANSVVVDSAGEAYVTGSTGSTDFPTMNPVQSASAGVINAFVAKFNASGNALVYSTYLGGSGAPCFSGDTCGDVGFGIAVDSSGNAYVAGVAASPDFPTVNPIQPNLAGGPWDVFVAKFNANGNTLVYSTYLGGSGEDLGNSIAVDSSGNAYVTGGTGSNDFPTTSGAFQGTLRGGACPSNDDTCGDAFVAKLKPDGSALVYSTYFGGSLGEIGTGIAVDSSSTTYVTGFTDSQDFPTLNPLQTTCASFNTGQNCPFIAQLSPDGGSLIYSTYLGGSSQGRSYSIALDATNNAYITGRTNATDFPTQNPLQAADAGDYDVIVAKILTPPDFALGVASGTSPSATVTAGGTATYKLAVSPIGGLNQTLNLTCSGAPATVNCTPSPASVTLDGTNAQNVTVTVTTTGRAMSASLPGSGEWPGRPPALPFSLSLTALVAAGLISSRRCLAITTQSTALARPRGRTALWSLSAALLLGLLTACGGGGSNTASGTPPGTYTMTVTATDTQVNPSLSHQTTLTLIVN